ncbi:hypothetical protein D3C71_1686700 [compost metagenome]
MQVHFAGNFLDCHRFAVMGQDVILDEANRIDRSQIALGKRNALLFEQSFLHPVQGSDQLILFNRLQQVIRRPADERRLHIVKLIVTGDYDKIRIHPSGHLLHKLQSVHAWQPDIGQHQLRFLLLDEIQSPGTVLRISANLKAVIFPANNFP